MVDRQALEPKLAIELMRLTIVAGEAMTTAMNRRGVDIGRINYYNNKRLHTSLKLQSPKKFTNSFIKNLSK
ncbi:MAG: hypothetical protein EOM88_04455 [Clostridia bacterium]|nr:hypothetical protein [Clostridia bacterium]